MSVEPEEIERWNKWFAMECNNQAWDLASSAQPDEAQKRELMLTAYASVYHWSKVGEPVNDARGDILLAHAHATVGEFDLALRYASRAFAYYEEHGGEDWEIAFSHLELAYALHADADAWAKHIDVVLSVIAKMDKEDAEIVQDELDRVCARVGK